MVYSEGCPSKAAEAKKHLISVREASGSKLDRS